MKRSIISVILAAVMLSGCSDKAEVTDTLAFTDLNIPVTRGQAVKMLALSRYSFDEINRLPRDIDFEDSDISNWCDKYINAAVKAGLISGTQENTFLQNDELTLEQTNFLLKKMQNNKQLVLQYANEDRKKPVSLDIWLQAYTAANDGITEKEIVIFADKTTCPQLMDGYVLSSEGLLNSEGISIPAGAFNCGINALIKDGCILALKDITTQEPEIREALVKETDEHGALLSVKGCNIYYEYANGITLKKGEKVNFISSGNKITKTLT